MRYEIELTTGSKYQVEEDATLQQISELISNKNTILVFTEHIFRGEEIIAVRKLDKSKLEATIDSDDFEKEIDRAVKEIKETIIETSELLSLINDPDALQEKMRAFEAKYGLR